MLDPWDGYRVIVDVYYLLLIILQVGHLSLAHGIVRIYPQPLYPLPPLLLSRGSTAGCQLVATAPQLDQDLHCDRTPQGCRVPSRSKLITVAISLP